MPPFARPLRAHPTPRYWRHRALVRARRSYHYEQTAFGSGTLVQRRQQRRVTAFDTSMTAS